MNDIIVSPSALINEVNTSVSPFVSKKSLYESAFSFNKANTVNTQNNSYKEKDVSGYSGLVEAISGAVGGIVQTLPSLGIGSNARKKELEKQTQANVTLLDAQAEYNKEKSKNTTKILLITGVLFMVILVIYFTLKK